MALKEHSPIVSQPDLFPLKDTESFRDDMELMSLPFFSISKNPRREPIEHRYHVDGRERYVRVTGGEKGIATIWDNDLLIYARTLIASKMARGEQPSSTVTFTINDYLAATGKNRSAKSYEAFRESVVRLQTTTVFTNIAAGDFVEDAGFGWLQGFRMRKVRRRDGSEVVAACQLTLCDWLFKAAVAQRFLAVDRSYFDLTSALERKLWLIIRRHLGKQPRWFIGLDKLQEKCASQREGRKFRHEIGQLVERDPFPEFHLSLSSDPHPMLKGKTGRALYFVAQPRRTQEALPH